MDFSSGLKPLWSYWMSWDSHVILQPWNPRLLMLVLWHLVLLLICLDMVLNLQDKWCIWHPLFYVKCLVAFKLCKLCYIWIYMLYLWYFEVISHQINRAYICWLKASCCCQCSASHFMVCLILYRRWQNHLNVFYATFADNAGVIVNPKGEMKGNFS